MFALGFGVVLHKTFNEIDELFAAAVTLYHYTSIDGANGIMGSRRIRPSNGQGDAAFGIGVYLTSLSPSQHLMTQVAENNYDGIVRNFPDRTKVAIEFSFLDGFVKKVSNDRDVWLYTDGDLKLDMHSTSKVFVGNASGGYTEWHFNQWPTK